MTTRSTGAARTPDPDALLTEALDDLRSTVAELVADPPRQHEVLQAIAGSLLHMEADNSPISSRRPIAAFIESVLPLGGSSVRPEDMEAALAGLHKVLEEEGAAKPQITSKLVAAYRTAGVFDSALESLDDALQVRPDDELQPALPARPDLRQLIRSGVSGFLELSPGLQAVQLEWRETVGHTAALRGFIQIETPAIERTEVLTAKGGVGHEIYGLRRLGAEAGEDTDSELGLRYDHTVPFARYLVAHSGEVSFPFRRFTVGPVWRGERPQDGRFRQFDQADVDIVAREKLPLRCDVEIPRVVDDALSKLDIGDYTFRISNRKVLQGVLEGLHIDDVEGAIRVLDKLDKLGPEGVRTTLIETVGVTSHAADEALKLAQIRTEGTGFVREVRELCRANEIDNETLDEGLEELRFVIDSLTGKMNGSVVADLSIARGLDYYTGTVYEVQWHKHPEVGSIASGGRYENLTGEFGKENLPGVGMSIGLTRILATMVKHSEIQPGRVSPSDVLVMCQEQNQFDRAEEIAERLRGAGYGAEVHLEAQRSHKKGLKYADRKGIPFVIFVGFEEAKDLRAEAGTPSSDPGRTTAVELDNWIPPIPPNALNKTSQQ